jgi:hypothetical protein
VTDTRTILMTAEQAAEIERHIGQLMRANQNERASLMMALSLAYKFAPPTEPALPDNVVEFGSYSKRVPCA